MKYSSSNKPLYCPMTQSTWYKETYTQTPVGVLWHSTGVNNPTVKRYVQPSDNVSDRDYWLKIIGKNPYGNDWNHTEQDAGVNFYGKDTPEENPDNKGDTGEIEKPEETPNKPSDTSSNLIAYILKMIWKFIKSLIGK